jgi:alanine racemase
VKIAIDLDRVAQNADQIARQVRVPLYAVVKANAYGLGAKAVAKAVADSAAGFCVFSLSEARQYGLWEIASKPILCIGPPDAATAEDYLALHARPAVSTVEDARRLRTATPALSVDTGMQRFACPREQVPTALAFCNEAFTHAVRPAQVAELIEIVGARRCDLKLHAAGSKLLDQPDCRLDAVRPGLALYRGAVRIATPLVEVSDGRGPAGYTGFEVPRHGVILCGYSQGLRPGPCRINGRPSRVIEVGMQSAFVECQPADRAGDEVVLIGDGLEAEQIAPAWNASPQNVLVSLLSQQR